MTRRICHTPPECRDIDIIIPELEDAIGTSKKRLWTDRDVAVLKKYYPRGVPVQKLAIYLKRNPSNVAKKASLLGLTWGEDMNE